METSVPQRSQPPAILLTMYAGGANPPHILPIVRSLVSRGHRAHVPAGPGACARPLPGDAA